MTSGEGAVVAAEDSTRLPEFGSMLRAAFNIVDEFNKKW